MADKLEINKGIFKYSLVGAAVGFLSMIFLIFIFAIALMNTMMEQSGIIVFTIIAAALGGLVGGFFAGYKIKQMGLICGLTTGTVMVAALFVLRLIFAEGAIVSAPIVGVFVAMLLCAIVGAVIGINLKFNHSKMKSRR